jgi:small subunit ribosomal protein S16
MAVSIRLRREGTKNRPYYKVVVADRRSPRDGKFIEIIGAYDPKVKGHNATLNIDRVEYWISKGAQPSDTVRSLIKKSKRATGTTEAAGKADQSPPQSVEESSSPIAPSGDDAS